jgi:hypothetical protein
MLRLIIGAAVLGAVGYAGWKVYQNVKSGSGFPGVSTTPSADGLTPFQREQAAGLAQKFNPGYSGLDGGCMSCGMGGAAVEIL